jgi:hypothetical protein
MPLLNATYPAIASLYRVARVATGLLAAVWIFASAASYFFVPGLYFDQTTVPSPERRSVMFAASVAFSALVAAPYRWTLRGVPFLFRLAVFLVVSLWLLAVSAQAFLGFARGTKHWLVVPVSAVLAAFAIVLPLSLVVARRIYNGSAKHAA